MAGALIVSPKDFIKDDLLKYLHAIEISNDKNDIMDMDNIIKHIDHKKSRKKALKFNWEKSCNIMYNTLKHYDKYKNRGYRFSNRHNL